MSKQRFLVLAASTYQVPFIRCAKELGLEVITLDNRPDNPGHEIADRSHHVDTMDSTRVLAIARRENICGILAACTDVALPAAARTAEVMGLVGPPLAAVDIVCDKIAFRSWQVAQGFPTPPVHMVTNTLDIPTHRAWGDWLVVKPDRSSGSKGVFIVRSPSELQSRLMESMKYSPTGRAIVESYIKGHHVTCEGILAGGRVEAFWILDRQVAAPPFATTVGHHLPTRLPRINQSSLRHIVEDIWCRLGVDEGPFDCDAIVTENNDVFVLELAPRVGGNSVPKLLQAASGFSMVEYVVRHAAGLPTNLPGEASMRPAGIVLLGADAEGQLEYDAEAAACLKEEAWVHDFSFEKSPGEAVSVFANGRHRVGEVLVLGRSRDEVDCRAREVRDRLRIRAK